MKPAANPDDLPEIAIRIPGTWPGPVELSEALPADYVLGDHVLRLPDGDRVAVASLPADGEFPDLFIRGCRRSLDARECRRIRGYDVNVCLMGRGGSVDAARRMMQAAAAVISGGGLGVFVDNSGNAHDGRDWLALAFDRDASAVILAFVGIYSDAVDVWSVGMHVLGLRDAIMPCTGDTRADVALLSGLLGYTLAREHAVADGDFVGDGRDTSFRVHDDVQPRIPPGTPMHNPYGCWRLEQVGPC